MKSCVIISGGRLDVQFASEFIEQEKPQMIIAADKGLRFCKETGILPTQIVGDFDSLGEGVLSEYEEMRIPIRRFYPVKDATDTEIAVRLGMELGAEKITIVGASEGNRLDHLFGNVMTMIIPQKEGIDCFLLDAHNRARVLLKPLEIDRRDQYGTYVSFLPMTSRVEGVTLRGFKYPLTDACFSVEESGSLGVSNEISEETAKVDFREGILLMLEGRD